MRIAVFISGRGSNLQSIIDEWQSGALPVELAMVFSNKADAFGLERAKKAGIPTMVLSHKDFASREDYDKAIHHRMVEQKIDLIVLAGFMRLLSTWFVQQWEGRLINIHPSLLPAFPGLHTHQAALEMGVKYSGCTVFFVNEGVDAGPIIDQAIVPVFSGDTEETLAARILVEEHKILPSVIAKLSNGAIKLIDGKVVGVVIHQTT